MHANEHMLTPFHLISKNSLMMYMQIKPSGVNETMKSAKTNDRARDSIQLESTR